MSAASAFTTHTPTSCMHITFSKLKWKRSVPAHERAFCKILGVSHPSSPCVCAMLSQSAAPSVRNVVCAQACTCNMFLFDLHAVARSCVCAFYTHCVRSCALVLVSVRTHMHVFTYAVRRGGSRQTHTHSPGRRRRQAYLYMCIKRTHSQHSPGTRFYMRHFSTHRLRSVCECVSVSIYDASLRA